MNKAKAYKDLQRRQTRKFNELLMSLCSTERATRRLEASTAASAPLAAGGGTGAAGGSVAAISSLSGASHAAAAMAYVSTMLPKIGGGGSAGTGRQPPPWAHASGEARPATAVCRKSAAAASGDAAAASQRSQHARAGSCRIFSAVSPAASSWGAQRDVPPAAVASVTLGSGERNCAGGGGRLTVCQHAAPASGSGGSASDGDADEIDAGHDRKAVVFPTASQMRQLLSLIDPSRDFGSCRPSGGGRRPVGSGEQRRRGSRSALRHPDDGARPAAQLTPKPVTAADVQGMNDAASGAASAPAAAAAAAVLQQQQPTRPSRPAAVAKQVSFVDVHPSQVQYVSPVPPPSPPPAPAPATAAHLDAAPETGKSVELSTPVLSEKNLLLLAAALEAPTEAAQAQTGNVVIGGGGGPGSRAPDDRTISWIRERQIAGELFSDIPEEDEEGLDRT